MWSIFLTRNSTWPDCQQLLLTWFNTKEHQRVSKEALQWIENNAPDGTHDVWRYAQEQFSETDPNWNPNEAKEQLCLQRYQEALLNGIKAEGKKAMNIGKISEVLKKADESLSQSYESLCEAYQLYSPFDPEATENQCMVNMSFVSQAQADTKQKLWDLEGFAGMNATQLIEVSTKVCFNHDQEERKEAKQRIKKKAELLVAAVVETETSIVRGQGCGHGHGHEEVKVAQI